MKDGEGGRITSVKDFFRSGHIQMALALGLSIIVLAYFSKRVFDTPIRPLYLSITSLIMAGYEAVANQKKYRHLAKTTYWVPAILLATLIIILIHAM